MHYWKGSGGVGPIRWPPLTDFALAPAAPPLVSLRPQVSPAATAEYVVGLTRAIAEWPYKRDASALACVVKVRTTGTATAAAVAAAAPPPDGMKKPVTAVWLGQLQMIPGVSDKRAAAIAGRYPSFRALMDAYRDPRLPQAAKELLLEVRGRGGMGCKVMRALRPSRKLVCGRSLAAFPRTLFAGPGGQRPQAHQALARHLPLLHDARPQRGHRRHHRQVAAPRGAAAAATRQSSLQTLSPPWTTFEQSHFAVACASRRGRSAHVHTQVLKPARRLLARVRGGGHYKCGARTCRTKWRPHRLRQRCLRQVDAVLAALGAAAVALADLLLDLEQHAAVELRGGGQKCSDKAREHTRPCGHHPLSRPFAASAAAAGTHVVLQGSSLEMES